MSLQPPESNLAIPAWLRDVEDEFLSDTQQAELDVLFNQIWPADHVRQIPGAVDAKASRFVSRLLARDASTYEEIPQWQLLYPAALRAIDQFVQLNHAVPLSELPDDATVELLTRMESGSLGGFPAIQDGVNLDQRLLFKTLRRHCIQGCLADERWGGNDQGIVWRAMGYPSPAEDVFPIE